MTLFAPSETTAGGTGRLRPSRRRGPGAPHRLAVLAVAAAVAALLALTFTGCGEAPAEGASVLLVSADSLRADRLAPWNPRPRRPLPPVPHLEALAGEGTVYTEAWATSPWTAPSMVSVMTGLHPPSHGVAYRDDTTPAALPTLPRLFAEAGYAIGNFSFFSEISYFRRLGLGPAAPNLTHERVAESFDEWLGSLPEGEPFFAWVHLLEPHLPYGASGYVATEVSVPGSSGLERSQLQGTVPVGSVGFAAGDRERLLELYDRDVAEMDRVLGRLLTSLEAEGRREGTLVVFVADHGEELLEHGWVGHASTAIEAKLVPEVLRIPLLLAGPGVPEGRVRRGLVQQVDVAPTLLELTGLPVPERMDGEPLPGTAAAELAGNPRRAVFFDSSPGGNLTPVERRGERIQGVSDGNCLLAVHTYPERAPRLTAVPVGRRGPTSTSAPRRRGGADACSGGTLDSLRRWLEAWRGRQAEQRLALLADAGGPAAPDSERVDAWEPGLEIASPEPGTRLDWDETSGQVTLAWGEGGGEEGAQGTPEEDGAGEGGAGVYWIEYRLGTTPAVSGSFRVEQDRVTFGPVPQGFWNDLAAYSPYRIRVADPEGERRSEWVEFEVLPSR